MFKSWCLFFSEVLPRLYYNVRSHKYVLVVVLPQVETIGGRLASEAMRAVGCGYDLSGIQRICSDERNYILLLLRPVDRDDL